MSATRTQDTFYRITCEHCMREMQVLGYAPGAFECPFCGGANAGGAPDGQADAVPLPRGAVPLSALRCRLIPVFDDPPDSLPVHPNDLPTRFVPIPIGDNAPEDEP